jgi:hypothetical protein
VFEGDPLALDVCLQQRNLLPHGPGRWRSRTRVACLEPTPEGDVLLLAGYRIDELVDGLRLEAGLPLIDAEGFLPGQERFEVGLPSDWRERTTDEDRQRREARTYCESGDPGRQVAGASTLARLELFDRGPWVEEAVVAWERCVGGRGDLAMLGLCSHELRWLQAARDKLTPRLLGFMWAISAQNAQVASIAQRLGPRPDLDETNEQLLERVPRELAAAAAGLRRRERAGYAGFPRYAAELAECEDTQRQAALLVQACDVLMRRYGSGWMPGRIEEIGDLLEQALSLLHAERSPKSRAYALYRLAEVRRLLGLVELAQFAREEALDLLDDGQGGYLDQRLAQAIQDDSDVS